VSPDAEPVPSDRPVLFLMANTFETGGGERQFVILAEGLKSTRFDLKLGCLRKRGAFADGLDGIAEFPPGGSLFKLQAQRARIHLARHLRSNRVSIAHSFDFYSNLMMIPSARLAGVPIVVGSQRQLGDLISPFRNKVQNAVFRWCDRVVCNSCAAASRLQQAGIGKNKLVVIPNALPAEAFATTDSLLERVSGGVRIVMIARMNDPAKRHDILLQAAAQLAAKHSNLEFVLVGDGPLRPSLEEVAAKLGLRSDGAKSRVRFLGERRDISAVLAGCDVSVLPSMSESLSNSIMESMAAGVPAVACRVGGNEELIRDGENGFLVSAGSAEEIADRIERLVREPELRKAFGAAAKKDAQRFTVDRIRDEYEQFYGALLEEKGIRQAALQIADQPHRSFAAESAAQDDNR
jgi:L-malate glycosyltransferase